MKILVTGSTGLLGSRLVPSLLDSGYQVITHGLTQSADIQADLTDASNSQLILDQCQPQLVINLVCLANVDRCELEPDLAFQLNVRVVENITCWIRKHPQTRLIHISTDQVYDGNAIHEENDVTILNTYALTKYAAELAALHVDALVLRTNFFGRSLTTSKKSFSDWLIDSMQHQKSLTLFTDVAFSPLSLPTLCRLITGLVSTKTSGVFNLGSREGMTKRDFAYALASHFSLPVAHAVDGTQKDMNLSARRPTGMMMNVTQFEKVFKQSLPTLTQEIAHAMQ